MLCGGPIPPYPTNGRASEHGNASEMLVAYLGEMPRMTRWAEALPTRATRKYKYVGCPFVANHGTQEKLCARGMHIGHNWRTYMAGNASVRSTIRPKHPKGTTSVSAVEREKRSTFDLSVLLARSDNVLKGNYTLYGCGMYLICTTSFLYELCSIWNYLSCCI